jgi:hypothetical protein
VVWRMGGIVGRKVWAEENIMVVVGAREEEDWRREGDGSNELSDLFSFCFSDLTVSGELDMPNLTASVPASSRHNLVFRLFSLFPF